MSELDRQQTKQIARVIAQKAGELNAQIEAAVKSGLMVSVIVEHKSRPELGGKIPVLHVSTGRPMADIIIPAQEERAS